MKKIFCVISHTHWDREWYMPFENFRLKLVDLIDRLLVIIEKNPDYIFHLDAQTVVLEDYLEIREQNREILEKYIKSGNIIVGPWYLQNDFFLTSGEATIRNLLEGRKIATSFGRCSNCGYAPDQFGNMSQIPQILNNFSVDSFIFGRGYDEFYKDEQGKIRRKKKPIEFYWEAPDGSKVLSSYMLGWYNNAQRIPTDPDKAFEIVKRSEDSFSDKMISNYYLLMNGVDHLEAQDDLLEAVDNFNKKYGDERIIKQYEMDRYISDLKQSLNQSGQEIPVYKGELRMGASSQILAGTLSSRANIKIMNCHLQNMLEQRLEPLYTMLELNGMENIYSSDHFRYTWKKLLKNHPHDTICGCSVDAVHRHSADELERIEEVVADLWNRGLTELFYHSEIVKNSDKKLYAINVVNTVSKPMHGGVFAEIEFLSDENVRNFKIQDINKQDVPFEVLRKEKIIKDVTSPLNLPGTLDVDKYFVFFDAGKVNAYSSKGFLVVPDDGEIEFAQNKDERILENEYLKVTVDENGRIDIFDKQNGKMYTDAIYLEDKADRGHSYEYFNAGDKAILSKEFKPSVKVIENNSIEGKIEIKWNMLLPKDYDFENLKRSEEKDFVDVTLSLQLLRGRRFLNVDYTVTNNCLSHRLRLVLNTGFSCKAECFADTPFDVRKREDCFFEPDPQTQVFPNTSMSLLKEDNSGVAILTYGTYASEHISDGELSVTLIRCTGEINRDIDLNVTGGKMWSVSGNQMIGTVCGTLGICPFSGDFEKDDILNESLKMRNPLVSYCNCVDRKHFSGGRPAVQGTALDGLYYLPDFYENSEVLDNKPALEITGDGISVSAFKKSEDRQGYILRFFNYSEKNQTAFVKIKGKIYQTNMAEEEKEYLSNDELSVDVAPKKIITLYIE